MDTTTNTNVNLLPALYKAGSDLAPVFGSVFKFHERSSRSLPLPVQTRKLRNRVPAMCLVMPFYPCMWNKDTTVAALNNAIYLLQGKMKKKFTAGFIDRTVTLFRSILSMLDFNTHTQGLVVRLTDKGVNIVYLKFPVRSLLTFGKSGYLLECAVNKRQEKDFYLLVFDIIQTSVYQYSQGTLSRVIVRSAGNSHSAATIFDLLEPAHGSPVFVTGIPQLANIFCNKYGRELFFYLPCVNTSYSPEIIRQLAEDIIAKWQEWHSKFLTGKIREANQAHRLYCGAEQVLKALKDLKDGVLLLDKKLKRKLLRSARGRNNSPVEADLLVQFDRFIERGNLVEITPPGFLRHFGNISLLHDNKSEDTIIRPWHSQAGDGNTIY